ncbi:MAG: hypothetical protein ACRERU_03230 [Methylococcales bacterium]
MADLNAWQHDMDYGNCEFSDRISEVESGFTTNNNECGCRTRWADARLCECQRNIRPFAEDSTLKFLDLMGRIFNCHSKFSAFQKVPLHELKVRFVRLGFEVGEAFCLSDETFYNVTTDAERAGTVRGVSPRVLWQRVFKRMFLNGRYGDDITTFPERMNSGSIVYYSTRPAWTNISPKDYLMPMIQKAQKRHLAELTALIPLKYPGVALKIHNEWRDKYFSGNITFGRYILSPK